MDVMQVGVVGRRDLVYIDPCTAGSVVNVERAKNYKDIHKDFNYAVVEVDDSGDFNIIQISGYNPEDGLFCDLVEV